MSVLKNAGIAKSESLEGVRPGNDDTDCDHFQDVDGLEKTIVVNKKNTSNSRSVSIVSSIARGSEIFIA